MSDFELRAIEVHSSYAWDFRWISKVLDFAHRNDLNALVLHRNDVVDQVVFPGLLFGVEKGAAKNIFERYDIAYRKIYKYTPTRRSGPMLRRDYLRRVVECAGRLGIAVYLENKELYFPDVLLELFPELTKGGHVCASDPFWVSFLETKYTELLEDVPRIAGVITSLGTGESRVSITSNRCTCDLCRAMTTERWYSELFGAMYKPLASKGKRLIVRDFVFTKKNQETLASQFDALPVDVAIAIKNTPHDYYPTFPANKLIETLGSRDKWIEFDAMAQYFGWGIGPSAMLDDFRFRFAQARKHGAKGIILRTDWESLDGHTAFDTPNIVNLYAGAAFAKSSASTDEDICGKWLTDTATLDPTADEIGQREAVDWLVALLRDSWGAMRKGLFVKDCVYNDCSTFPVGYEQALWLTIEKNSLQDWLPEKSSVYDATEKNILSIIAEKDEAVGDAIALERKVVGCGCKAFKPEFLAHLRVHFAANVLYIKGFRAHATLFAVLRFGLEKNSVDAMLGPVNVSEALLRAFAEIDGVIAEYRRFYETTSLPHAFYQLLNADKLECFRDDARRLAARRLGWGSR